MALPDGDVSAPWPPKPFDVAADHYSLMDSWYSSDVEALHEHYRGATASARPSQYAGGVVGRMARFFWGRPIQQAAKRLHMPIASDLARTGSDLLFSTPPQWVLAETDVKGGKKEFEAAQKRLEVLLEATDVNSTLLEAAEIQAALGGVYLRLWWDTDVTTKVMVSHVGADAAVPEWRYGQLAAVTFWTVVREDKQGTWRHLERHSPGFIEHGLYCGDKDTLGRVFPLDQIPETEWAADLDYDSEGRLPTGVKGLTAAYVPNVRPNRVWRNVPQLSLLGRSDFDGLEPLFDALDEVWTSWMRDIDHGKSRLMVSADALEDHGPGKGASFDPEQPVFTPVPTDGLGSAADGGSGGPLVEAQQFAIRHEEHKATFRELVVRILVTAGYSVADFGDDEMSSAVTATEINARRELSNRTREKKISHWRAAMEPLARTMLELDQLVYGDHPTYGDRFEIVADPEMKFPVRQDQSPIAMSTTIQAMVSAGAMSREEAVREFHPNWSSEQVEAEVAAIWADYDRQNAIAGLPSEFDYPEEPTEAEEEPATLAEGDLGADGDELAGDAGV